MTNGKQVTISVNVILDRNLHIDTLQKQTE